MQTFKDAEGREWTIELNIAKARALRKRFATLEEFRELDFFDYSAILAKIEDPFFAADFLFLICEEDAETLGVDSESFGRALKGRALFDATAALLAEYVDFFPDPTIAAKIRAIVDKTNDAREKLAEAISQTTERLINESLNDAAAELGALSFNASHTPEAL